MSICYPRCISLCIFETRLFFIGGPSACSGVGMVESLLSPCPSRDPEGSVVDTDSPAAIIILVHVALILAVCVAALGRTALKSPPSLDITKSWSVDRSRFKPVLFALIFFNMAKPFACSTFHLNNRASTARDLWIYRIISVPQMTGNIKTLTVIP